MKKYLISYDLQNQRNYEHIYQLLSTWGAVQLTESQWLVTLSSGISEAYRSIANILNYDDTFAIVELSTGVHWMSRNVNFVANSWLSQNIAANELVA